MFDQESVYQVEGGCLPFEFLVMGPIENNVYLITCPDGVMVVDPTCEPERILQALGGRKVCAIVLTHKHWDHVGAAAALREATGAPVVASALDAEYITGAVAMPLENHPIEPCTVDVTVEGGEELELGGVTWNVIATPGHTPGSICLFANAEAGTVVGGAPVLVAGDTLFFGSIGRTDFPGGSMDDMRKSLAKLAQLPDDTIVLPGHNALTTIKDERRRVFARFLPADPQLRL